MERRAASGVETASVDAGSSAGSDGDASVVAQDPRRQVVFATPTQSVDDLSLGGLRGIQFGAGVSIASDAPGRTLATDAFSSRISACVSSGVSVSPDVDVGFTSLVPGLTIDPVSQINFAKVKGGGNILGHTQFARKRPKRIICVLTSHEGESLRNYMLFKMM